MNVPYTLTVNGAAVEVRRVSVSAAPVNHVWPGYQRSFGQAEDAWIAAFDLAGPAEVEIAIAMEAVASIELRPHRYAPDITRDGNRIRFRLARPEHLTLLVNGLHGALHLFADPPFHYERQKDDLYFGPGEHDAGLILPRSGQRVCIDAGAVVYGAIVIFEADDVTVTGRGILDSSRIKCPKEAKAGEPGGEVMAGIRQFGFGFPEWYVGGNLVVYRSSRVKIDGIILVDSPSWSVIARNGCRDLVIDNIKIVGQWRYNSDGIDICASENVIVRNSFIRAFDDCFVARGPYLHGETEPVRAIRVEHCTLWCDWGKALEIWCGEKETRIEDIEFRDLALIHLTHFAFSITTTYGSGDTLVRDIRYRDIEIETEDFYPTPLYQVEDCPGFPDNDSEFVPPLLAMNRGQLGHDLGNQRCEPAVSLDGYHLRYEQIELTDIRTRGRKLPIWLEAEPGLLEIAGIEITGTAFSELRCDGVRRLNIHPNRLVTKPATGRKQPKKAEPSGRL